MLRKHPWHLKVLAWRMSAYPALWAPLCCSKSQVLSANIRDRILEGQAVGATIQRALIRTNQLNRINFKKSAQKIFKRKLLLTKSVLGGVRGSEEV